MKTKCKSKAKEYTCTCETEKQIEHGTGQIKYLPKRTADIKYKDQTDIRDESNPNRKLR